MSRLMLLVLFVSAVFLWFIIWVCLISKTDHEPLLLTIIILSHELAPLKPIWFWCHLIVENLHRSGRISVILRTYLASLAKLTFLAYLTVGTLFLKLWAISWFLHKMDWNHLFICFFSFIIINIFLQELMNVISNNIPSIAELLNISSYIIVIT